MCLKKSNTWRLAGILTTFSFPPPLCQTQHPEWYVPEQTLAGKKWVSQEYTWTGYNVNSTSHYSGGLILGLLEHILIPESQTSFSFQPYKNKALLQGSQNEVTLIMVISAFLYHCISLQHCQSFYAVFPYTGSQITHNYLTFLFKILITFPSLIFHICLQHICPVLQLTSLTFSSNEPALAESYACKLHPESFCSITLYFLKIFPHLLYMQRLWSCSLDIIFLYKDA